MKDQEKRLLRCMGEIDDPLILEAEVRRFPRKHWKGVLAMAACVAVVLAMPLLWREGFHPGEQGPSEIQKMDTQVDAPAETSIDNHWSIGPWSLGMTAQEVGVEIDDSGLWTGDGLTVQFDVFSKTVCRMSAEEDCALTLPNGLGIGSTAQEVEAAYPTAFPMDGSYTMMDDNGWELSFRMSGDLVSGIQMQSHGDCLLYALSVSELTIYTMADDNGTWDALTVTEKAAKRICTTLTISEPEPLSAEIKPAAQIWIDFGMGAGLWMDASLDYASIFAYSGDSLDPGRVDGTGFTWDISCGVFGGLTDAVSQALQNPTETWETESPAEEPEDEIAMTE